MHSPLNLAVLCNATLRYDMHPSNVLLRKSLHQTVSPLPPSLQNTLFCGYPNRPKVQTDRQHAILQNPPSPHTPLLMRQNADTSKEIRVVNSSYITSIGLAGKFYSGGPRRSRALNVKARQRYRVEACIETYCNVTKGKGARCGISVRHRDKIWRSESGEKASILGRSACARSLQTTLVEVDPDRSRS